MAGRALTQAGSPSILAEAASETKSGQRTANSFTGIGALSIPEMDMRRLKQEQASYYDFATLVCLEEPRSSLDGFFYREMYATLYRHLDFIPTDLMRDAVVLDLFCNRGMHFDFYRTRDARTIIGCDISQGALRRGMARYPGPYHRIRADCEDLPFRPASCNVVCCFGGFHHSPRKDRLLDEIYRVLKPGGTILLSDPNDGHILRHVTEATQRRSGHASSFEDPSHPRDTLAQLTAHGLEVQHLRFYNIASEALFHAADIAEKAGTPLVWLPRLALLIARRIESRLDQVLLTRFPALAWSYFVVAHKPTFNAPAPQGSTHS